jgi:hypothetical protein
MSVVSRWVMVFWLLMLSTACGGPIQAAAPLESSTPMPAPSSTQVRLPSATPSPSPSPTVTLSVTPTATATALPTPTAVPRVREAVVVYRPESDSRNVAEVRWSANGKQLIYALSPRRGGYLLDWNEYDFESGKAHAALSPYPDFGATWERLNLGYPVNTDSYAELQGFISPNNKLLLFPNAGFPDVYSTPNYIYVMPAEGGDRRPILGPTFRGKVGKAVWINYETKVIFDYRYNAGVEVFVSDLTRDVTNLLLDLSGSPEGLNTEWSVSPDQSLIFVPGRGQSQIVSIKGSTLFSFESPYGMENPTWGLNSQSVYYWDGNDARLERYMLGDTAPRSVLMLHDLTSTSPVKVVRGMPFRVSPDEKQIAFWWKNWIWVVKLRAE